MELWKEISMPEIIEKYEVSTKGRVRRISNKRLRTLRISPKSGYSYVGFHTEHKKRHIMKKVAKLVASTFIPNPENCLFVDHKDGNRLNDAVENLRWCHRWQNNLNRAPVKSKKYKGVYPTPSGKWMAQIYLHRQFYSCGTWDSAELAAEAYNKRALELHGEFAKLNQVSL